MLNLARLRNAGRVAAGRRRRRRLKRRTTFFSSSASSSGIVLSSLVFNLNSRPRARRRTHSLVRSQDDKEWSGTYKAMVYQAEEDAKAFAEDVERREKRHAAELASSTAALRTEHAVAAEHAANTIEALASEVEKSERRVAALAAELTRAGEDAERRAEEAAAEAEKNTTRLLEEQAAALSAAAAEAVVKERAHRATILDEIRMKTAALKEAYDVNGTALERSHRSNRLSLAVFSLHAAASRGGSFEKEAELVRSAAATAGGDASDDALITAVLKTLPTKGTPTTERLADRLEDVQRAARALALVPDGGGGGVLSHLVATLAAMFRVSERGGGSGGGSGEGAGVEAAIAVAAEAMAAGELAAAADALEKGAEGTAAAAAVEGWVKDARDRQRVELALSVLRSHTAAVAASLA